MRPADHRDEMDTPIAPGAYFVDTDGDEESSLGGTFVIEGAGWSSMGAGPKKVFGEGYVSLLIVEVDQVWSPACEAPAPIAAGTTAEDLANQFAAAGFTIQEAVSPVSAFGQSGYHLVVDGPAECTGTANSVWEGPTFGRFYHDPEGHVVEYWFLDVDDTPVMVEASWAPSSSEEEVAELQGVARHPGDHSLVGIFSHRPRAALVESSAGRWCPGSRTSPIQCSSQAWSY